MKKSKGMKAIEEVARNQGISVSEVRREIEIAIDAAMSSPDPDARAFWDKYIQSGTRPAPEEFVIIMAKNVKAKKKSQSLRWMN